MREIKFRAWDKVDKIILEIGSLFFETGGIKGFFKKSEHFLHKNNYILMQYTGFKDKNGKDIYEGDICKFANWKSKEIIWNDGRYMLGNTMVICCKMECDEMEVIGNIYENKGLLNK
jgi:uncharacterized phage protein (TIGR01671 family)